jgi:hypothetical protein
MNPGWTKSISIALAVALAAAAGAMQAPLDRLNVALGLALPIAAERDPKLALLNMAPGGLRALFINYLAIRSQALKQKGRFYDAAQLATLICRSQRQFPGVWVFYSWEMAWNISAATHTGEERWLWVTNGMRLLRDEGIPLNRTSLELYRELGWIFFFKIGDVMDEKHWTYKQRWAAEMQHLLGAPPAGETPAVIDAFRPIAQAPLDKDLARQGAERIQPQALRALLADPNVARYAELLSPYGVRVDDTLLDAYNRYTDDAAVADTRAVIGKPPLASDRDRAIAELINSEKHAGARAKMLAFVRAQILWNVYKMDPQWMLSIMDRYQAPLDWRLPWPHGVYWVTYGIEVCGSLSRTDVSALNADRIVMFCFKLLTWQGRLAYVENPEQPDAPALTMFSDPRYILPANRAHLQFVEAYRQSAGRDADVRPYEDGHINYLADVICMLAAMQDWDGAKEWLRWVKDYYKLKGGRWDATSVGDFVQDVYTGDSRPTLNAAVSQATAAFQQAYYLLAMGKVRGTQGFAASFAFARRLCDAYNQGLPAESQDRLTEDLAVGVLTEMLREPRTAGYSLSLEERRTLYQQAELIPVTMPDGTRFSMQAMVYGYIQRRLRAQFGDDPSRFDQYFPQPKDFGAFQEWVRKAFQQPPVKPR